MKAEKISLKGGYRFDHFADQAAASLISLGASEKIVLPMGREARPCVIRGERVRTGQIIARERDGQGCPIHASVNGEVEKIGEIEFFGVQILALTIRRNGDDGDNAVCRLEGWSPNWKGLPPKKIKRLLHEAGLNLFDGEDSLNQAEDLIVCATDAEMYRVSMAVLLTPVATPRFAAGLGILRKAAPKARIHVVFEENDSALQNALFEEEASLADVIFHSIDPKYPLSADRVLIPAILGKTYAKGLPSSTKKAAMLDVQTVLHIYNAVAEGRPIIERTLALAGPGFLEPTHIRVRLGSSVQHVVEGRLNADSEQRLILDSPLTGPAIENLDQPIGRTWSRIIALPEDRAHRLLPFIRPGADVDSHSSAFLSAILPTSKKPTTNLHGEERPCISCGFCEQVCPVQIIPHLLHKYSSRGVVDEQLLTLRIFDCVDCNLCSYVCPSKIPVGTHIREGKQRLRETEAPNLPLQKNEARHSGML